MRWLFLVLMFTFGEAARSTAQGMCGNFEFEICQEAPKSPWAYNSTPSHPGAFEVYYRVYIKTKNGSTLPSHYVFDYLSFNGNAVVNGFTSKVNVQKTLQISQWAYANTLTGQNPYLGYLNLSAAGEVDWTVGSATTCPSASAPVDLPLIPNVSPGASSTDRALLFIIVLDAMIGDEVSFKMNSGDIIDCACEISGSLAVQQCSTKLAITMPSPPACGAATIDFPPIYLPPNSPNYFLPVRLTGTTPQSQVNEVDGVVHIVPQMNGIADLELIPVKTSDPLLPILKFDTRKNADGSFDVYFYRDPSQQVSWSPISTEAVLFFVRIDGLFNLSQGAKFDMSLKAGRFASFGNTCKLNSIPATNVLPGLPACSEGIKLSSSASYGSNCEISVAYELTHNASSPLDLDGLHFEFWYKHAINAPGTVIGGLPCPACWAAPVQVLNNNGDSFWVLSYTFDKTLNGGPLQLDSKTTFEVPFPGQTDGCLEPYVYYAEAESNGSGCAIDVDLIDFPVCDPRIFVQVYSPLTSSGYGVDYYKTRLQSMGSSYIVENDDECSLHKYCPDLTQSPYKITVLNTQPTEYACGVSTYDLVLIQKNILGTQPFTNPFQWVAANAKKDNQVSVHDILQLRALILGSSNSFDAASWYYIDEAFNFGSEPLKSAYYDANMISNVPSAAYRVFSAVKVGDVSGNCNCGSAPNAAPNAAADRSEESRAPAESLRAGAGMGQVSGKSVSIPVFAAFNGPLEGLQAAFRFDPSKFRFINLTPNAEAGLSRGHFGLARTDKGEIRFSWSFDDPEALLPAGAWLFTVELERLDLTSALPDGEWLSLDAQSMEAEAYPAGGSIAPLKFEWDRAAELAAPRSVETLKVKAAPNPFRQAGSMVFVTAVAPGEASIALSDLSGRQVFVQKEALRAGENRVRLATEAGQLPAGSYWLSVEQNGARAAQRIVKI